MEIIKASGEKEKFNKEKLYQSLKRAGVERSVAERISQDTAKGVRSGTSSEQIFNQVALSLGKENSLLAARYNLKRAIMELGPTGFPFEKYIAKILEAYGFSTRTDQRVRGYCVVHEVDVVAQKGNERFMVECKYHNARGVHSDIKVALYVYARFLDVKKAWEKIPSQKHFFHQPWLVTNTRCTRGAIRYARCVGLRITSWRYPQGESLEYLIEKKGLYPVTILPSQTRFAKERLAEKEIVLAKDLAKYSIDDLARITGIQTNIIKNLQIEAKELCQC